MRLELQSLACFSGRVRPLCWDGFRRGGSWRLQQRGCCRSGMLVGGVSGSARFRCLRFLPSQSLVPLEKHELVPGLRFREAASLDVPAGAGFGSEFQHHGRREDDAARAPWRVRRPGRWRGFRCSVTNSKTQKQGWRQFMFLTKDKNSWGIHQSSVALIYLIVFFLFFFNFCFCFCFFQDRVSHSPG